MNVLVLCATEQSIQSRKAEKWLVKLYGEENPFLHDSDFFYVGLGIQQNALNRCASNISKIIDNCQQVLYPRQKFDVIISEHCPTKSYISIYNDQVLILLDMLLKAGGVFVSNTMNIDVTTVHPSTYVFATTLSDWLGENYSYVGTEFEDSSELIIFQKMS